MFHAAIILIAFATGALTGLTGASGMSLLISGLMLLGADIREIIALTFPVTLANSVSSAIPYWRRGHVQKRVALIVSLSAMAGVYLGFQIGETLPSGTLRIIMLTALLFAGCKLLFGKDKPQIDSESEVTQNGWWLAAFGVLAGTIMGIMGGGGGVFIAIVLMFAFSLRAKAAVGTSIVIMAAAAVPGLLLHTLEGTMRWDLVGLILPVSMVSGFVAARWGRDLPDRRIKQLLGILLLTMVSVLLAKMLFPPTP